MNQDKKNNTPPEIFRESWSISIYSGKSPFSLEPLKQIATPTITRHHVTDIRASFVADPFMISVNKTWYLFMEIMNADTGNGEIGLMTSADGLTWEYQQVVLKEDYHLSYPFVFEHEGACYMVPETLGANAVRMYKAVNFPYTWQFVNNLTEGQFADPTIFYHNTLWWMFASAFPKPNEKLNLFYSKKITGPYTQHPQSPLIEKNYRIARPAGRINNKDGKLIRVCQDCFPVYGSSVRAFEILKLNTKSYQEKELLESPVLQASPETDKWNSRGMHHIDAHKLDDETWLACVDGCCNLEPLIKKRAVWIFDNNYKLPTYLSVASFREHLDIPVSLVYLGTPDEDIVNLFKNLGGDIEFIIEADKKNSKKTSSVSHKKNRLFRMKIMERWPKELVMLFDGDVIFSEKIKDLIPEINNYFKSHDANQSLVGGVCEDDLYYFYTAKRLSNNDLKFCSDEEIEIYMQELFDKNWRERMSVAKFNCGVLLMYNCVDLADVWRSYYLEGLNHPKVNPEDDQVPLSIALYDLKIKTIEINNAYNSKGRLTGGYAIYHAWNGKWKTELKKIINGEPNLEDYGIIAKKYFEKIPKHWWLQKKHAHVFNSL